MSNLRLTAYSIPFSSFTHFETVAHFSIDIVLFKSNRNLNLYVEESG